MKNKRIEQHTQEYTSYKNEYVGSFQSKSMEYNSIMPVRYHTHIGEESRNITTSLYKETVSHIGAVWTLTFFYMAHRKYKG